jgi:hypothetical protein
VRSPGGVSAARRAVGFHVAARHRSAKVLDDRCGEQVGIGGGVVHASAGALAIEAVADVEVLFEVVAEGKYVGIDALGCAGGPADGGTRTAGRAIARPGSTTTPAWLELANRVVEVPFGHADPPYV